MAMSLGSSGKRGARVRPEMNVTPLVDVVLVLLIIFMVVTPLLTRKLWIHLPKVEEKSEAEAPAEAEIPLVLSYHESGEIRINGAPVERAELPRRIERILAARRERVLYFDADDEADYGEAVSLIDLARGSGATTIAVLTERGEP